MADRIAKKTGYRNNHHPRRHRPLTQQKHFSHPQTPLDLCIRLFRRRPVVVVIIPRIPVQHFFPARRRRRDLRRVCALVLHAKPVHRIRIRIRQRRRRRRMGNPAPPLHTRRTPRRARFQRHRHLSHPRKSRRNRHRARQLGGLHLHAHGRSLRIAETDCGLARLGPSGAFVG